MTDSSVLFLKDSKGCGIFQTCGVGLGSGVDFFSVVEKFCLYKCL